MRIGHNMSAVNTTRLLGATTKNQSRIGEMLSSGYKINRASDNAAGLSISEKMRAQIRGLSQASRNAQDGISLVETADGALNEVHNILQRMRELSVQAANGTNTDDDRKMIQEEINGLVKEVTRISTDTDFNTMKLLDGSLAKNSPINSSPYVVIENKSSNGINVIDLDAFDFVTTPTSEDMIPNTAAGNEALKNTLKNEIVPQAINKIIDMFSPAFNYLKGSSIGIGLKIVNDPGVGGLTALASLGTNGSLGNYKEVPYQLTVNLNRLQFNSDGSLTSDSRQDLECTISHEFVHGLMYEALTVGMTGYTKGSSAEDKSIEFPLWFVEGMAQTASGGYANFNDYVNGHMQINSYKDLKDIKDSIKKYSLSYAGSDARQNAIVAYGTGYLACMYLGQMASGSSDVTADNIRKGLGNLLSDLVSGKSLDSVIHDRSNQKYNNTSDFKNNFGDDDSARFVQSLTKIVGEGNGSLITGNLTDTDLLPNSTTSDNSDLFKLNTQKEIVDNKYPDDINIYSGGSTSVGGSEPVPGYTSSLGNTTSTTNPTGPTGPTGLVSTIDLANISPIDGISYDSNTKTLKVSKNGDYTLKGIAALGVNVVVENGIKANITLDNVDINSNIGEGIKVSDNADLTIKLVGNNSITSSVGAGIGVSETGTLNITGDGSLDVKGGLGSAGIGGSFRSNSGTVNIKSGTITATGGDEAAGIGGASGMTGGVINITGGTVTANGGSSATGIGSGLGGSGTTVNINGETVVVKAKGGTNSKIDIGDSNVPSSNITNGIVFKGDNGTIYGKVEVHSNIDYGNGTLTISNGSTVTVSRTGSITGSGSIVSGIGSIIDNHGTINVPDISGIKDSIKNYIDDIENQITKRITEPSEPVEGNKLGQPTAKTINVTYNGGTSSVGLTGVWSVKKNGREVSETDLASVVANKNDTYTYTLTYDLSKYDGLFFNDNKNTGNSPIKSLNNVSLSGGQGIIGNNGKTLTYTYNVSVGAGASSNSSKGKLTLQVGANAEQTIGISIDGVSASDLKINNLSVATQDDAKKAMDSCSDAIKKVSKIRSDLGAYQNRLEHTIANLDNGQENLQSSESRIRDLDIAKGMAEYSKYQILSQVEQSILSQANQMANNVLNLLRA